MQDIKRQFELLCHQAVQVIPEQDLLDRLKAGKKLRVKLGADPTAPDLHLGHAVVLTKLKQFQDLGHEVIFLIGNFTALIGDPTGRLKTRPPLTQEEIAANTATYFDQVARILDVSKITIRFNAEWLDALSSKDIIELCSKITVAKLTEREDFAKRLKEHQPVYFHELLYPLFQAYDSVALQADVELGGTDQTLNLLLGRDVQEAYGQQPQIIMTLPILEGLDGKAKMSKSAQNYIGLTESADQAYGKLMSISDDLMYRYMHVLLDVSEEQISSLQARVAYGSTHPMALKKQMAYDIVSKFWSEDEAARAQEQFEALFQQKNYNQATAIALPENTANPLWIVELLKLLGAIQTTSEGKRLIQEGAVHIDDDKVEDFHANIVWRQGMIVRVGKHRIYKLAKS